MGGKSIGGGVEAEGLKEHQSDQNEIQSFIFNNSLFKIFLIVPSHIF